MALPEAYLSAKRMGSIPGWETDVVAVEPYRPWQGHDSSMLSYVEERFARIVRLKLPTPYRVLPPGRLGPFSHIPDPLRIFVRPALRACEQLGVERYDAVITWSTWHSVHLAGLALKHRHARLPWVAHFSDPWAKNSYSNFGKWTFKVNSAQERAVMETADKLLFTSTETVDLVLGGLPESLRSKASVLPHSFDRTLYRDNLRGPGRTVRYIGGLYGARSPEPLFKALELLHRAGRVSADGLAVEIVGSIDAKMRNSPSLAMLPDGLVAFKPPVDYLQSLALMKSSDLLLVIDAPAAINVFLPSKLVDYLGAGRPILGITPPGAAAAVITAMGGMVANPADPDAIAAALEAALDEVSERGNAPWGNESLRQRYSVEAVGEEMRIILDGLV